MRDKPSRVQTKTKTKTKTKTYVKVSHFGAHAIGSDQMSIGATECGARARGSPRRVNIASVRDAELHGVGGGQAGHTGGDGVVAHAVATGAKARATQEGQVARLGARGSAHSSPSRQAPL